jgi:Domain of unknown function (DUF1707)
MAMLLDEQEICAGLGVTMEEKKITSESLTLSEKERAIEFLIKAFSNDIINIDEFERRIESVHASKTHEELHQIVADLPNEDSKKITEDENIVCNMNNRTITGSILFTKRLNIKATSSKLNLDYRSIDLPDGIYELNISAVSTDIVIKLPTQYSVDNRITNQLASGDPIIKIDNERRSVVIKLVGNIEKSKIRVVNG